MDSNPRHDVSGHNARGIWSAVPTWPNTRASRKEKSMNILLSSVVERLLRQISVLKAKFRPYFIVFSNSLSTYLLNMYKDVCTVSEVRTPSSEKIICSICATVYKMTWKLPYQTPIPQKSFYSPFSDIWVWGDFLIKTYTWPLPIIYKIWVSRKTTFLINHRVILHVYCRNYIILHRWRVSFFFIFYTYNNK